jgi:hypothetical protein
MYIVAVHNISDPEKFAAGAVDAIPKIPGDIKLHSSLPNAEGSRAVCLWEADSIDRVRSLIEEGEGMEGVPGLGPFSNNEFFEVDPKHPLTMGLPS